MQHNRCIALAAIGRLFVVIYLSHEHMNKGRNIEVSTHESEMFVLSLGGQIGLHPFWGEANLLELAVPHQERQDGPPHTRADQGKVRHKPGRWIKFVC